MDTRPTTETLYDLYNVTSKSSTLPIEPPHPTQFGESPGPRERLKQTAPFPVHNKQRPFLRSDGHGRLSTTFPSPQIFLSLRDASAFCKFIPPCGRQDKRRLRERYARAWTLLQVTALGSPLVHGSPQASGSRLSEALGTFLDRQREPLLHLHTPPPFRHESRSCHDDCHSRVSCHARASRLPLNRLFLVSRVAERARQAGGVGERARQAEGHEGGGEDLLEGAIAGEFQSVEARVRDWEVRGRAVIQLDVQLRFQLLEPSRWYLPRSPAPPVSERVRE